MNTKKVLFLIPDGVGIRNFLYSSIIKNLKNDAKIIFWSPLPIDAFHEVKAMHEIDFEYRYIKLFPENFKTRICRESANYARLIHNSKLVNNSTILKNWNYNPKSKKLKILNFIAQKVGNIISSKYNNILRLEQDAINGWSKKIIANYQNDLQLLAPTSIFITHQRVASLMPICLAAKNLGIPVVSAIYSWDNLPKARLSVKADKYVLWSQYMKEEMKLYYPEIKNEKLIVTGTPQFEFYQNQSSYLKREEFAKKNDLDPTKKWVCYSGDDILTSPNDPLYLKDLAHAIENSELKQDVQILFRRCPVDFSDRYDHVLDKYTMIKSIDPLWHTNNEGWTSYFPRYEDVDLLVNMVRHCDLVINLGSTMAHDFAVFDKPCLYIKYDKEENRKWKSETVYNFQHFRSLKGLDAIGWINSEEEIKEKIMKALKNPNSIGKDRQKWLEKIVQHPLEDSSKNIANILLGK